MLNHVLVPLDGSKLSEEALAYALKLVGPGGRITLVSAVEVPDIPTYGYYPTVALPDYEAAMKDMLPAAKHYLEGLAAELVKGDVTVDTEAHIGEPSQVIVEMAGKHQVEAIVMSTHGRAGLGKWLFGSVTHKILGTKCCPVFVVPSKAAA